jgi:uncharacterized protein (TIGR02246 family)
MPHAKPRTAHLVASPDDVEAQFYDALREGDLDKLMAIWSDDDEIVCVHPGGPRVVGARAIRASFEAIFANGGVPVQTENVRRVHSLDAAIHNLIESVLVTSTEGAERASVIATNVFVKTAQGWRLVAHHASPGDANEAIDSTDPPSTLH